MPERFAVVVSAEHASNRVPREWRALFRGQEALLASHRGWDPGSLEQARELARRFDAPLFATSVTRLLVDANRTPNARGCFSELTRGLPAAEREALLAEWHAPHRAEVEAAVRAAIDGGDTVLHVAAHSFTPVWKGRVREVDVGLLHDPNRRREAELVRAWQRDLQEREPGLRIRLNRPYRGWTDGLGTTLRSRLPAARYLAFELEVNQAITTGNASRWRALRSVIAASLQAVA